MEREHNHDGTIQKVLMLGNGFDLYNHLPTKYIHFLRITSHLAEHRPSNFKTAGEILISYIQQHNEDGNDAFIEGCYNHHQDSYADAQIDQSDLQRLTDLAKDNPWFTYFNNSISGSDLRERWVDFETEISNVIHVLYGFLTTLTLNNNSSFDPPEDPLVNDLIRDFGGFLIRTEDNPTIDSYTLNPDYVYELPPYSGRFIVNRKKIFTDLKMHLDALSTALEIYLKIFVDSITRYAYTDSTKAKFTRPHENFNCIINFNYTHICESIYGGGIPEIIHIHGQLSDNKNRQKNSRIVLGIPSDSLDDEGNVDTLYIAFKKYYQRTIIGTENKYLSWIVQPNLEYNLHVMGHSLDVIDADIIKELFSKAIKITIYYHAPDESEEGKDIAEAKGNHVRNLIRIYGRTEYEQMLRKKGLNYKPDKDLFQDINSTV